MQVRCIRNEERKKNKKRCAKVRTHTQKMHSLDLYAVLPPLSFLRFIVIIIFAFAFGSLGFVVFSFVLFIWCTNKCDRHSSFSILFICACRHSLTHTQTHTWARTHVCSRHCTVHWSCYSLFGTNIDVDDDDEDEDNNKPMRVVVAMVANAKRSHYDPISFLFVFRIHHNGILLSSLSLFLFLFRSLSRSSFFHVNTIIRTNC